MPNIQFATSDRRSEAENRNAKRGVGEEKCILITSAGPSGGLTSNSSSLGKEKLIEISFQQKMEFGNWLCLTQCG